LIWICTGSFEIGMFFIVSLTNGIEFCSSIEEVVISSTDGVIDGDCCSLAWLDCFKSWSFSFWTFVVSIN
jgi:hypothetical protein